MRASRLLQDFTSDRLLLDAAIDRVTASGGTPLYDSILDALALLDRQAGSNSAIVVLTDGEDNSSSSVPATVIAQANLQNNTPVCTIGLGSGVGIPPLQDIARDTGCTFAEASDADALERILQSLTGGVLEGRVLVTGVGRFEPPLPAGEYRIAGVLVTTLNSQLFNTPFDFPVTLQSATSILSMRGQLFPRPPVPYTAAQEAQGLLPVLSP